MNDKIQFELDWNENIPYGVTDLKESLQISGENIQCCVKNCANWVQRRRRGQKPQVSNFCPAHGISISKSPTYVYKDFTRNFIVGHALLNRIKKVESWRLGNERSEDAVSWNVFVGLYGLGGLKQAFEKLSGLKPVENPELFLWGNRIDVKCSTLPELEQIRSKLENGLTIPTEPDIMLRVPGQAIILIEAKFGSANGTFKYKESRFGSIGDYLKRYFSKPGMADPLNRKWIAKQTPENVLEQLCRNAIFARWLAAKGERPIVVNLVRKMSANDEEKFRNHLSSDRILFFRRTWEELYGLPIIAIEKATTLRRYFENKTLNLSRAFELNSRC